MAAVVLPLTPLTWQMAGWSDLNTLLYAVTFLAWASQERSCPLCMENDHTEECVLALPKSPNSLKHASVVEFSKREEWVPCKGDPVLALLTTLCVASSNGSSPHCLLDFYGVVCGSGVAIWCKKQTVECVVR